LVLVKILNEQFNDRETKQCGLYRGNKFFIQKSTRTPLIYQVDPNICKFNLTKTNSTESFQTSTAIFLTANKETDCNQENVIDYVESIQPRFAILGAYSTVLVKIKKIKLRNTGFLSSFCFQERKQQ
jgi:hypothetical protein